MQTQWQDFINQYTPVSDEADKNFIVNLADLGLLCVEGVDAKKFLQGQLTCHLDDISEIQTQLGAQCNPQGRIIYFFRLFYYQERYYLQMPRTLIPIALAALKKYAVFFKVNLSDASDSFICIGYSGENLENYFSKTPKKIDELIQSDNCLILKLKERYEIFGTFNFISSLWEKLMTDHHYLSSESWKEINFKQNIPTIYPETSEKFLPHDIQLPQLNAISFNKGCYTGQEIIARMQYRAKIKNQLACFTVTTELTPQRGADIYNATTVVGMLVDYYKIGYNTYRLQIMTAETNDLFLDAHKQHPLQR